MHSTDAAWFGRPNCNVTKRFVSLLIIKVFYKVNYFRFLKLAFERVSIFFHSKCKQKANMCAYDLCFLLQLVFYFF